MEGHDQAVLDSGSQCSFDESRVAQGARNNRPEPGLPSQELTRAPYAAVVWQAHFDKEQVHPDAGNDLNSLKSAGEEPGRAEFGRAAKELPHDGSKTLVIANDSDNNRRRRHGKLHGSTRPWQVASRVGSLAWSRSRCAGTAATHGTEGGRGLPLQTGTKLTGLS
jgi:hypothetical protein